jgi:hypothetical protein
MFNPQSMVNQFDAKNKAYAEAVLDTIEAFQLSNIKSFDELTNSTFTTYTSKLVNTVKETNVNAKEIVKSGKFKVGITTGHKE